MGERDFDVIGDVHGCIDELDELLAKLGDSRTKVFLGDFVDRGPSSPGVLRRVMELCASGRALAVQGNHDSKLWRRLRGRKVSVGPDLAGTLAQLEAEPPETRARIADFLEALPFQLHLDGGRLVVAHAGLALEHHGSGSKAARAFALYGETTGETDDCGLPVRLDWAQRYRGEPPSSTATPRSSSRAG